MSKPELKVNKLQKNTISFELEGDKQVYTLTYDFNQFVDAEAVTGCNLLRAIGNRGFISATEFRALLYALLKAAHPVVEVKEAGELMTRDTATVSHAVAMVLGVPEEEEMEGAPPAE